MFPAHGEGGLVHDGQALADRLRISEAVVAHGVLVLFGVLGVDPVDLGGLDEAVGFDLEGTQHGGGVGGEIRVAGPSGENHDALLLEVAHCSSSNEALGHLLNLNGGLNAGRDLHLLDGGLEGKGVDDGAQHAHLVGDGAVDATLGGKYLASDEVAPADDEGDLDTLLVNLGDLLGDVIEDRGVEPGARFSGQCLAGEFDENAFGGFTDWVRGHRDIMAGPAEAQLTGLLEFLAINDREPREFELLVMLLTPMRRRTKVNSVKRSIIAVLSIVMMLGCYAGIPGPDGSQASKSDRNMSMPASQQELLKKLFRASDLFDAGNFTAAEAIVDAEIDNPAFGKTMHKLKAKLLAKRGAKAESLAKYMALLNQEYGVWNPQPFELKEPFDLAIELNETESIDALAVRILEPQPTTKLLNCPEFELPNTAATPTKRRAYALVVMADVCANRGHLREQINYLQSAKIIRPQDTIILVRLADALHDRAQTGDQELSRLHLSQAYLQEAARPQVRTAIQRLARLYRMSALP